MSLDDGFIVRPHSGFAMIYDRDLAFDIQSENCKQ